MIKKEVSIIGMPIDLGANIKGSRFAPDKIRELIIPFFKKKKIPYIDHGNVDVPKTKKKINNSLKTKNLGEIIKTCHNFQKQKKCFGKDCFPLILGGDHTTTICYIQDLGKDNNLGLIYFDAHGDFNNPKTTPSGNVHGMVVSEISSGKGNSLNVLCRIARSCIHQRNIVLIGTRDFDLEEKVLLKKSEIKIFSIYDVKKKGIKVVVEQAVKIASRNTDKFHVSVDMDVIDPAFAPGVSVPVENGLTRKEILEAMHLVSSSNINSLDIVELNPLRDVSNKTVKLAAKMIEALFENEK